MDQTQPMPTDENAYQHASITREDFKRELLQSEVFQAITESIVSQGYSNLTLAPVVNFPDAELIETLIGIRGQDGKSIQFFPIRILYLDKNNAPQPK